MPKIKKQTNKENLQSEKQKAEKTVTKKTGEKSSYYEAIGRRRVATARVRLHVVSNGEVTVGKSQLKKGDMIVNNRPIENYFYGDIYKQIYLEPFRTTNTVGRFAVSAVIVGGGLVGQVGAFSLGVSRALEKVDKEKYRPILKKGGFMTRDPRAKERRKAGFAQKARARKQSPKR